jgi:predicted nucleotidyltransferase
MVTEQDKQIITRCAEKYNASSVILFGSSLKTDKDAGDIDLAVKGIKASLFFKFYAELFKNLSKPVDLIDLSVKSSFSEFVEQTGMQIYGKTA